MKKSVSNNSNRKKQRKMSYNIMCYKRIYNFNVIKAFF